MLLEHLSLLNLRDKTIRKIPNQNILATGFMYFTAFIAEEQEA